MSKNTDERVKRQIERNFTYHTPTPEQVEALKQVRDTAKAFANLINDLVPNGREKSLAITKLEECVMQANAGIVRPVE